MHCTHNAWQEQKIPIYMQSFIFSKGKVISMHALRGHTLICLFFEQFGAETTERQDEEISYYKKDNVVMFKKEDGTFEATDFNKVTKNLFKYRLFMCERFYPGIPTQDQFNSGFNQETLSLLGSAKIERALISPAVPVLNTDQIQMSHTVT